MKSKHLIFIIFTYFFLADSVVAQNNSVLSEGNWYKIGVTKSGIYKIDQELIQNLGLSLANININNVRLFGNGGGMLPQNTTDFRFQDLYENDVQVVGSGNSISESTYLLFYGQGPDELFYNPETETYEYHKNIYSDTVYYFLNIDNVANRKIQNQASLTVAAEQTITTYDALYTHEIDQVNVLISGREWFGESFEINRSQTYNFTANLANTGSLRLTVSAMSRRQDSLGVQVNGLGVGGMSFPFVSSVAYSQVGNLRTETFELENAMITDKQNLSIQLTMAALSGSALANLNYLFVEANAKLEYRNTALPFSSKQSLNSANANFQLSSASAALKIWDITNPLRPRAQQFTTSSSLADFVTTTGFLKTFIAFENKDAQRPFAIRKVENQNIRGHATPDLVIVTHPQFKAEAERLAAHRQAFSGYSVAVFTTKQVYNEFSSGRQDVTAIRDMARFFHQKEDGKLKYLLLMGASSYDYKDRITTKGNWVPTYQSVESLDPIRTYSSDDYFGFLGDNVGTWLEEQGSVELHQLDIGVGRLPVNSAQEAKNAVDKIIHYETNPQSMGAWRKNITFIGDDGDNNSHQNYSEELGKIVTDDYSSFNINRIYVDEFEQEPRASGKRSPETNKAIVDQLEKGSLIVNYIGHGNENSWAEERIFGSNDIGNLTNRHRLPLFITATCEFGRHDNPNFRSGAEKLITTANKGAIAVLTTSRPVFNTTNQVLNRAFFRNAFEKIDGQYQTLGEVFKATKNQAIQGVLNRNFILLGDPSMKLAYPKQDISLQGLQHLNHRNFSTDTISSLQEVALSGIISDENGVVEEFNGVVELLVFDKATQRSTKGYSTSPMSYMQFDNVIHRGQASVVNGAFELVFRVSKNIDYAFGEGRFSLYAYENNGINDAAGADQSVIIGGSGQNSGISSVPLINLFINDTTFINNSRVNKKPKLIAQLSDENGINISNAGIGKGISAEIRSKAYYDVLKLDDFYITELDTYKHGRVSASLGDLPVGDYELTLTAWNNNNGSNSETIQFIVTDTTELIIENFILFPNPASAETNFQFKHNRGGEKLEIIVDVFNMSGNRIARFEEEVDIATAILTPFQWDLRSNTGQKLNSGMYLMKLSVRSANDGAKNVASQKLIVIN